MKRRTLYPLSTWALWVLGVPLACIAAGFVAVAQTPANILVFDNPQLWWLGGTAPFAGLIVLYGVIRRRRAMDRFVSPNLAVLLAPRVGSTRQAIRAGLVVLTILMIAAAVIGPRWGQYLEERKVYGADVVVALDVSRSMLARDVEPSRLKRAKREIRQQLTERTAFQHSHRLALLAFAGSTSLRLPLTTDHLAFRSKLEQAAVGMVPRGGTALAEAIRAAAELFTRSPKEATKVILLCTDGEDHEGDPVEAARSAFEEQGIRVFTVGVGDPSRSAGAQVPAGDGSPKPLLYQGQIVFSRLDVDGLRKIAAAGGGQFTSVTELRRLVDAIAATHRAQLSVDERVRHQPRYQWFVAAALVLLAFETMTNERSSGKAESDVFRTWQLEPAA